MNTLLVTGGAGFIGSNFIRLYLKTHPECRIINLDALTYAGNLDNTQDFDDPSRYEFVKGNICDEPLVRRLIDRVDAVINFAAESHVDRSIEHVQDFLTTNILGLRVLLDAAMAKGIKRFLHISTDEVYGSLQTGTADEHYPLLPNSPYSASKASADLLARSYAKTFHYPIMIARSSNNFGPYQYPEKVIPLFITNLMNHKKVPLYGKGDNRREWIYVEDNCRGLSLILDRGKPGEIYNISSGVELSNLELTHILLNALGKSDDAIEYVQDRPGHDFRYSISCDKLKSLGFNPAWDFQTAIAHTISWYQSNTHWWLPLKNNKFTSK